MALDTEPILIPNFRFDKTFPGTLTLGYYWPGELVFTVKPKEPKHTLQLENSVGASDATSQLRQLQFGGGGVAGSEVIIRVAGTRFVAGCGTLIELPMIVNLVEDIIYLIAEVQSGDDEDDVATDIDAMLTAANNGDAAPANSHRFTRNGATTAQIKAAMENYFGADEAVAFVTVANEVTLLCGTVGADGDNQQIRVATLPSVPSPLPTFGDSSQPLLANKGAGIPLGPIRDTNLIDTPTTLAIPSDSLFSEFGTKLTGTAGSGSFNQAQGRDPEFKTLQAGGGRNFDANYWYSIPGGQRGLNVVTLMFTHDNAEIPGQLDFQLVPRAIFTGGLQQNLAKAADNGLPATFSMLGDESAIPLYLDGFFQRM